jgi:hypothetical protein
MALKFTLEEAPPLGRDSVSGRIYSTAAVFDRLSAVRVETREGVRHGIIKNIACDRFYLVLSGDGTFRIGGECIVVEETDLLIIPRGTAPGVCAPADRSGDGSSRVLPCRSRRHGDSHAAVGGIDVRPEALPSLAVSSFANRAFERLVE